MGSHLPSFSALVVAASILVACGPDAPTREVEGPPYVAQEIWITYDSPAYRGFGRRTALTRADARAQAEALRQRVMAGEDVGLLAKRHSNAPGGVAFGFSGWRARDPSRLDERDRALLRTPVGDVTDLVEWLGGWWFAKRIPVQRGKYLESIFDSLSRQRAKARAIAVLWKDAYLANPKRFPRTKEEARARAEEAHRFALSGVDFADAARRYTDDDETRESGGLLTGTGPDGEKTEWVRRVETWIPQSVLDAIFETEAGKVYPKVIESERGFFVLKVDERKDVPPAVSR